MATSRHRLSGGRHLGAGRLVRLIQDGYVFVQAATGDSEPEPECPWEGTQYEEDCCDEYNYSGGGLRTSVTGDFITPSEVYNRGNTAGFKTSVFGFGLINSTVPSHSQLFSENRNNLNNAANREQSACFVIGSDLSFAKYHPSLNVHSRIPTVSYSKIKKVYDSTPLMSLSNENGFISSLSTKQNSGGIDYSHDKETLIQPRNTSNSRGVNDPRNPDPRLVADIFNADDPDIAAQSGDPPLDVCYAMASLCGDRFGQDYCTRENSPCRNGNATVTNPDTGELVDCCECCGKEPEPEPEQCIEGEDCGPCKNCTNGVCTEIPNCCNGSCPPDIVCPLCQTCQPAPAGSVGQCGECVNDSTSTDCRCTGCNTCETCIGDTCVPIDCSGGDGPTDCCPPEPCDDGDCNPDNNQCCPGDGTNDCVACDPCPDIFRIAYNSEGVLTSLEGNYLARDMYVPMYFKHDMNQGLGGKQIVASNDIILSCKLELTVKNVYGKIAYVGAKPYCKTSNFDTYRVKQDIEPSSVSKTEYSPGNAWNASYGRHPDDVDLTTKTTTTVSNQVKSLDKIYIDITAIAKQAQSDDGIIRLMIEPKNYFSEISTDAGVAVTNDGLKEALESHPAMLLEFYDSGVKGPKVHLNVHQGLRPVTQRRMPWQRIAL